MRLADMDDPGFLLPDWVVTRPRLTGICGSDAKQVFMDWGEVQSPDNPMKAFFSLPQVLGHEVVADVVALGPEAEGLEVGERVVLNPWLSCAPRGVDAGVPGVRARRLSACAGASPTGPIAPGIHTGTSKRRERRLRRADARARLDAVQGPRRRARRARGVRRPVRGDRSTRSRGTHRRRAAKAMVYGAGALGTCATAILRALYPDVEVLVVARFDAQADMRPQARRAR